MTWDDFPVATLDETDEWDAFPLAQEEHEPPEWLSGKPPKWNYQRIKTLEDELTLFPKGDPLHQQKLNDFLYERAKSEVAEDRAVREQKKFQASGLTPEEYAQKLYEDDLVRKDYTANLPMPARIVSNVILNVGDNITALGARMAGDEFATAELLGDVSNRSAARQVGQGGGANLVESALDTIGTSALLAPTGAAGIASYYGTTKTNELYDQTGNLAHSVTGGAIEAGLTLIGMKYGSGTGRLVGALGGKGVGNVVGAAVNRAVAKHGLNKFYGGIASLASATGVEAIEENLTELLHAANDYWLNDNEEAMTGIVGRLAQTTAVSGLAGAFGGAAGVKSDLESQGRLKYKEFLKSYKATAKEVEDTTKGVEAAAADIEKRSIVRQDNAEQSGDDNSLLDNSLQNVRQQDAEQPIPVPPASRNGFGKATGRYKTSEAERNGYIDTVEEYNKSLTPKEETFDEAPENVDEHQQNVDQGIQTTPEAPPAAPAATAPTPPVDATEAPTATVQPDTVEVRPEAAEAAPTIDDSLPPVDPVIEESTKRTYPNSQVSSVRLPDGEVGLEVRHPNGRSVFVRPAKQVDLTDADITRVLADYGFEDTADNRDFIRQAVQGSFQIGAGGKDSMGLVQVLSGLSRKRTDQLSLHEAVHAARENGMWSDREWSALVNKYSDPNKDALAQEEDVAQASALWRNRGKSGLLNRLRSWLREFILNFSGISARIADRAEQKLASGDIWSRPGKPTADAVSELVAAVEKRGGLDPALLKKRRAQLANPTGIKNAAVEADRTAMEMAAVSSANPEKVADWDREAKQILKDSPEAGDQLAADVLANPRQLSDVETLTLINQRVQVRNEYNAALKSLEAANESGESDAIRDADIEAERLDNKLLALDKAVRKAGTEWGRAGIARQQAMEQDFTLAAMLTRKRAAVGGRPLTPDERTELAALQKKIEELQSQLDKSQNAKSERHGQREFPRLEREVSRGKARGEKRGKPDVKLDDNPTPAQISNLARELAKHFIGQGMKGRDTVTDAVHKELLKILPSFTRRATMDAISLYGQFKTLTKDEVSVKLREYSGELQQLAKIGDMESGKAPLKTGMERREPTDEERRLIKIVNELKKKHNFTTTDPAKQLRSALDARKTRLRNQIKDLEHEIRTRQKTVKQRGNPPTDRHVEKLIAERDILKAEHEAIFGKPGMTDAERLQAALRAVERSENEIKRRIAEKDFVSEDKAQLFDPQLEMAKFRRNALRATFNELKTLDPAAQADAARRANQGLQRRIADKIADTIMRQAKGDYAAKPRKAPLALDPVSQKLKGQLDGLMEGFNEEVRVDRMKRRLEAERESLEHQLREGITPKPKKERKPVPKELEQLEYQVRNRRKKIRAELERMKPRSWISRAFEPARLARTIMLGVDFGQVLRQGKLAIGHPVVMAKALPDMFKALANEKNETAFNQWIDSHPLAPLSSKAGLDLTTHEGSLTHQEELFQGYLADKVPGIAAFGRGYRTYLNALRFNWFTAAVENMGIGGEVSVEEAKVIANAINVATGRGAIADKYAGAMVALNDAFLAPRYQISRFQWLIGQPLLYSARTGTARTHKLIAKEYAKQLTGLAVYYGLMGMLADMIVDDDDKPTIELDPRSSDFLKIKIGDTRIDPLAGLQQWAHFAAKMYTGEKKELGGKVKKWEGYGAAGDAARFVRGRMAPLPGAIYDRFVAGETPGRENATGVEGAMTLMKNLFTPITPKEIYNGLQEHGLAKGTALGLMMMFGETINTYDQPKKK
jgi:hypothetical protein